jgi:cell division initiation protein
MRITPLDVRKQEFKKGMRGYDAEEVQAFLTTVADEYEAVLLDNKQLRERILELDEKIQEYRHMEKTLRDTLMTAERVLAEARDNARKEADLILKDAEMKAQQATENYRRQAAELRREVIDLHKEKEAFLARVKGLAEAQIQFIENHRTDFDELDRRLMGQPPRPASAPQRPAGETPVAPERPRGEGLRDEWRDYEPGRAAAAAERTPERPALDPWRAEAAPRAEAWSDTPAPRPAESAASAPAAVPRPVAELGPDDVDELLEPLHAVQEEVAALDREAAAVEPAPAESAARERVGTWNMDSFTRGLNDL